MINVEGRYISLPERREVFVGRATDNSEKIYCRFRASDGVETKIVLSDEAANALQRLLRGVLRGETPDTQTWILVEPETENT